MQFTLDGQKKNALVSPVPFTFYIETALAVASLYPLGGPSDGGTAVYLYLTDSRLLVDLGGELYGPACRFSYSEPSPSRDHVIARTILVRANLTSCSGQRDCGAGWGAMACVAPQYTGPLDINGAADVVVEVTINGQDFTSSGRTFRYYDPATWRVSSFSPSGGPLTGNTSIQIHGQFLQILGDVRCRFGDHPLASDTKATLLSAVRATCVSPHHWETTDGVKHVEVQLTLNGQHYLRFGTQAKLFTFYALNQPAYGLSVRSLTPSGGPHLGGTIINVRGVGFTALGPSGDEPLCTFSGEASARANARTSSDSVLCSAPRISVMASAYQENRLVDVIPNHQLDQHTSSSVSFRYFNASALSIASLYPLGGPSDGGTAVYLYPTDSRLLVDLGGELYGPACRFSYSEPSPSRDHVIARTILVRANLTSCSGQRDCGAGWGAMACVAPQYTGPLDINGAADVVVEVTINGQDFTSSGRTFRYYDPATWRVSSFSPSGGPLTGNTSIQIHGQFLQILGDVRCRFGDHPLASDTKATLLSAVRATCVSPHHWETTDGVKHVEVQLTLNGSITYASARRPSCLRFMRSTSLRMALVCEA